MLWFYLTTVEKSSSVRIMSEASLVTSLPLMPIEMPTSAAEIAGESFTPSLQCVSIARPMNR